MWSLKVKPTRQFDSIFLDKKSKIDNFLKMRFSQNDILSSRDLRTPLGTEISFPFMFCLQLWFFSNNCRAKWDLIRFAHEVSLFLLLSMTYFQTTMMTVRRGNEILLTAKRKHGRIERWFLMCANGNGSGNGSWLRMDAIGYFHY